MGVGSQRHVPAALRPGRTRYSLYCTRYWEGPRADLDGCGKSHPIGGSNTPTVQSLATIYTDYLIPALRKTVRHIFQFASYFL